MYEWLEPLRILLSLFFLVVSSWFDLKTREVPNEIWLLFAPIGFALSLIQFILGGDLNLAYWVVSFLLTCLLSLLLFYLGFMGGADAKALICLALVLPTYPSSLNSHIEARVLFPFFPLAVFINGVIVSSLLILCIGLLNLTRLIQNGGRLFDGLEREAFWKKAIAFMIGFKVDAGHLMVGSHYIPLEYSSKDNVDQHTRHLKISLLQEENKDAHSETLVGKIWVTPALPFLVFVTCGFVVALFAGDFMTWLTFQIIAAKT